MVSLAPDEHILMVDDAKYHGTKGKLHLTNMRLIFEHEKRGIIFKGTYTSVDFPLFNISEISIVGFGPFKKLTVNTRKERGSVGVPRHEFNVDNPESWKAKIEVASMALEGKVTKEREIITQQVIKTRCPYCGTLTEENLAYCPNCGGRLT